MQVAEAARQDFLGAGETVVAAALAEGDTELVLVARARVSQDLQTLEAEPVVAELLEDREL